MQADRLALAYLYVVFRLLRLVQRPDRRRRRRAARYDRRAARYDKTLDGYVSLVRPRPQRQTLHHPHELVGRDPVLSHEALL